MLPLKVTKKIIVKGVLDDPLMRARAERLSRGIDAEEELIVSDEEFDALARQELQSLPRHGRRSKDALTVIFNRFRFDDSNEEKQRHRDSFPSLDRHKFNGYGGFDWRDSGSGEFRRKTGLVCQPAWQLHTVVGCPFRCAYCNLGWFINLMMNMEEFVSRLDREIERCPRQTLFQYDNYTDTVCFEPEYGGTKLLVDYFAAQPGKSLELYVGKSDNVDFLLDYDHRGHTVCCWSLSGKMQRQEFEWRTASLEARVDAMRRCQEAGYPVRVRFSPIIPVRNWQEENREMIELLFEKVRPDLITFETIRFLTLKQMDESFGLSLLDEEFVRAMEKAEGEECAQGCQVPDAFRQEVYQFVISQLKRVSPSTPYAFCREKRTVWDHFEQDFSRHGQGPDDYVCNCGPHSAPATVSPVLLQRA